VIVDDDDAQLVAVARPRGLAGEVLSPCWGGLDVQ
jgi:hypothetical protein